MTYPAVMLRAKRSQAPQRIIQSVAVENVQERQRLVIGLRFPERRQKLFPPFFAWPVCANGV
jgi:hypothetical protein